MGEEVEDQARIEAMWRELKMLRALLGAVMDVEKAEPTGDPYDPASWASAAKSVVAGSEHARVCAEIESLRASLTRAEAEREALAREAHHFAEGTLALCRDVRNWPITTDLRTALEDGLVAKAHALQTRCLSRESTSDEG